MKTVVKNLLVAEKHQSLCPLWNSFRRK